MTKTIFVTGASTGTTSDREHHVEKALYAQRQELGDEKFIKFMEHSFWGG